MGLNLTEEIVGQFYQLKGYLVVYDIDMPMPITNSRRVGGHSDIDVLAINENEIVHVECQSWWGPGKAEEEKEFERLINRFRVARDFIFKKYPFLNGIKVCDRFITTGKPKRINTNSPWNRLKIKCEEHNIELVDMSIIICEFINLLQKKYPKSIGRIGKEPLLARFLIELIHDGILDKTLTGDQGRK